MDHGNSRRERPAVFTPPPIPAGVLRRPRLVLAGRDAITELWAGAGAGKTTALVMWERELREAGEAVAWLTLPAEGRRGPSLALLVASAFLHAEVPMLPDDQQDTAPIVGFDIRRVVGPVTLFLDEVHHLHGAVDPHWLLELLGAKPANVRVVLSGRYQPPSLARMALDSQPVVEYRSADLAFTLEEIADFFRGKQIELSPPDLEVVHSRSEGWAAAIALMAGWLRHSAHPTALPRDFIGDHRAVADYLVNEVLAQLTPGARDFLLTTAVVDATTVPLAVHLTKRNDAGELLSQLERQTGLLTHTADEDERYVYHTILLSYLRAESRRRDFDAFKRAQREAATWYREHGRAETALEYLLLSDAAEATLDFLDRDGLRLILSGHLSVVRRALDFLADHRLFSVTCRLLHATIDAPYFADSVSVEHDLAVARSAVDSLSRPMRLVLQALETMQASAADDVRSAMRRLDSAEDDLRASDGLSEMDDAIVDALLFSALARAWGFRTLGEPARALELLTPAIAAAQRSRRRWLHLVMVDTAASAAAEAGGWPDAARLQAQVLERAPLDLRPSDTVSARIQLAIETAEFEHGTGNPLAGIEEITSAADLAADAGLLIPARALRLLILLDSAPDQRTLLDQLHQLLLLHGRQAPLTLAACSYTYMSLNVRLHDRHRARAALKLIGDVLGESALETTVALAVLQPPGSRPTIVEPALERLLDNAPKCWHPATPVFAWLMLADWAERSGRASIADARVVRALDAAEPMQLRRPFLAESGRGAQLVESRAGRLGPYERFGQSVVESYSRRVPDPHAGGSATLTQKEREILRELPRHQSIGEIARKQRLSPNTVKTHLRSIYQKLGVSGRTAAVEKALTDELL